MVNFQRIMFFSLGLLLMGQAAIASEFIRIRGRTLMGEVIESQGTWRNRPLALFFWTHSDKSLFPLMNESSLVLDRNGFTRIGVHADQRQDLVRATLNQSLRGWDSLPDPSFTLAEGLKVTSLPSLIVFRPNGSYDLIKGKPAISNWIKHLNQTKAIPAAGQTRLVLGPNEKPVLVTQSLALLQTPNGVEKLEISRKKRTVLLKGKIVQTDSDSRSKTALVLSTSGELWQITLSGQKTRITTEVTTFCYREQDGRLGIIRKNGSFSDSRLGQQSLIFQTHEIIRGCLFSSDSGELVLFK